MVFSYSSRFAGLALAFASLTQPSCAQQSPETLSDDGIYYDRHLIDVSNLRYLYEGMLIGEAMIVADGMFDEETKWTLTLYQMIRADSGHHQARAARHLAYLGLPMDQIHAVWDPTYIDSIEDERKRAAFVFIDAVSTLPARVTADTHAMLRSHYTDRQIAALFELASFSAANAVHDNVLPIATDPVTLNWATENLAVVGWTPGANASQSLAEQQDALFAGALLEQARQEVLDNWDRADLTAPPAGFDTDWVNAITGYDVSRVTADRDHDGIEDPYDAFPLDPTRWAHANIADENLPDRSTPAFDVGAFDAPYYVPPATPDTVYAFSDRMRFDTQWNRENAMGTSRIEDYFAAGDRALEMKFLWQVFVVYQLSSGCTHCQVHGTRWLYELMEEEYAGSVPPEALDEIGDLFDFERSDRFTPAQLAAFRFARDAGPLPSRTNATHIEDLRRHYSNRQIQELMMVLVAGGRLSAGQQANVTVTDRTSMAWAMRELPQFGWNPGGHLGLPTEQRRLFMSEIAGVFITAGMSGEEVDFATEWIGLPVPLAIDTDGDGVADAYDGFPDDPDRWEDTDRDGIEDRADDDIDGDGLSNAREREIGSFPYKADSDGDGIDDRSEVEAGTDPVDPRRF